jgi:hypothetical protein
MKLPMKRKRKRKGDIHIIDARLGGTIHISVLRIYHDTAEGALGLVARSLRRFCSRKDSLAIVLSLHAVDLLKQPVRKLLRLGILWTQIEKVVRQLGGDLRFVFVVAKHQEDIFEYGRVFGVASRPAILCELRLHDALQRRSERRPDGEVNSSHGGERGEAGRRSSCSNSDGVERQREWRRARLFRVL